MNQVFRPFQWNNKTPGFRCKQFVFNFFFYQTRFGSAGDIIFVCVSITIFDNQSIDRHTVIGCFSSGISCAPQSKDGTTLLRLRIKKKEPARHKPARVNSVFCRHEQQGRSPASFGICVPHHKVFLDGATHANSAWINATNI